jgi:hypothetical protein
LAKVWTCINVYFMSSNAEILVEGSYLYFNQEINYSQENFKLVEFTDNSSFHIYSEILSRMESGEFLKIMVRFEMNAQYHPMFVRIEKSLGTRYCMETFKFDPQGQQLFYTFQNAQKSHEFKKLLNIKHFLTAPSFASSTIWTLSKKLDATGRTPLNLVSSPNTWDYENPPEDKLVFVDLKSRELQDFKINNSTLPASHFCIFGADSSSTQVELPVEVFVSKHHGIPYQMIHGDQRIVIKQLKKISL